MNGRAKDAASKVHICISVNQALSSFVVLLSNCKAERSAVVLVQQVRVRFVHQKTFNDSGVSHDCSFVQRGSLPVVSLVLVKIIVRIVFQKSNESTLTHLVLLKQVAQYHQ